MDTITRARQATSSVSEVARAAGVATSAVRFYDRHGIVESTRTSTNQRRFDADAACRIKVAKVAQRVGLTVAEIRSLLQHLPSEPQPDDWSAVCQSLIDEAERRMRELRAVLDELGSGGRLCEVSPH